MSRRRLPTIIPAKQWDMAIQGQTKSLRESPAPVKGSDDPRSILRLFPKSTPGWVVEIISSHKWKQTFQYLALYVLLRPFPEKRVVDLLKILGSSQSEHLFHSVQLLLGVTQLDPDERELFYHRITVGMPGFLPQSGERYLKSYRIRLFLSRWWFDPKRPPPKRYVGIGYNDQGSLGSGLSWKAQIIPDGEDLPEITPILTLLHKELGRKKRLSSSSSSTGGGSSD